MKTLLQLQQEYIIETRHISDFAVNKETGKKEPVWTDEEKTTTIGKKDISRIEMIVSVYEKGYETDKFQKVYIDKRDILDLAEKIKEIESEVCQGVYTDSYPF